MVAIRDIAVIGAGPSGLSAAKYLLAEKVFKVQLFEQKSTVGGVWAYNTLTIADDDFSVPRTKPSEKADNPIFTGSETEAPQFVSPVYDSLETNIPHTLMNFTDQPFPAGTSLFPGHAVVKRYLDTYAEELQHLIKFSSQILSAAKSSGQDGGWELEVLDLKTKEVTRTHYDAIVVASGHYNDPFIPDIPGLKHFNEAHPTAVSHSKFYKSPTSFANKKVIVVGNSASGLDISDQISKVTGLPVIVSERSTVTTPTNAAIIYKPEIAEFVPEGRKVRFADGDVEEDIDHIVFCTGYFYSFPFLKGLSPPVITDGSAANNLYQHMLYAPDPTLCFLGIPQRVVPFPFVEAQVGYLARVWAGRVPLPTDAELEDWQSEMTKAGQEGQGNIHSLKFPKDLNYINMLHSRSMTAEKREGLANGGMGKLPPYWNEEKAWTRERFPLIKAAARKLGDARHAIVDLRQLGFDFEAEKPLQDPQDKLEEGLSRLQMSVAPSIAIA